MTAVLLLTAALAGGLLWAMRREGKRLEEVRRLRELVAAVNIEPIARAMREFAVAVQQMAPVLQRAGKQLAEALERMEDRA